jgi:hypothetical protein
MSMEWSRPDETEIADADPVALKPGRRHGRDRQPQHLGIGAFGVGGAEPFDAGLVELGWKQRQAALGLKAECRSLVAVALLPPRARWRG